MNTSQLSGLLIFLYAIGIMVIFGILLVSWAFTVTAHLRNESAFAWLWKFIEFLRS